MIISHKRKYVYIAIPRTGSNSVASWLMAYADGEQLDFHHSWKVPRQYHDYTIFTVVRNPYERLFSFWWFYCKDEKRPNKYLNKNTTFSEFIDYLTTYIYDTQFDVPEQNYHQYYYRTISYAWRYFKIEDIIFTIPLKLLSDIERRGPFPYNGYSKTRPRSLGKDFLNSDEIQLINEYCPNDFKQFGYEMIKV